MNKLKLVLYTLLVLALVVNFLVNGLPENLTGYQSMGIIAILILLVVLIGYQILKIKKNKSH
ncbi:hypothetical protein ACFSQP_03145 [Bizionia sediminis]|uniref:LPXTG cell wall anchor domain-containing protein n=1 Tax=Bizionia sediminis TaxID=1737064 RepID=A0ABW5KSC4_9FLAO